jgi:hypothetical protein
MWRFKERHDDGGGGLPTLAFSACKARPTRGDQPRVCVLLASTPGPRAPGSVVSRHLGTHELSASALRPCMVGPALKPR